MAIYPVLAHEPAPELLSMPVGVDFSVIFRDGDFLTRDVTTPEPVLLRDATGNLAELARTALRAAGDRRFRLDLPGYDHLSASLILIMPLLLPSLPLRGAPVIAIGDRTSLHVCGSSDSDGVALLRTLAREHFDEGAAPVTPELQTLVEGVIRPF